MPFYAGSWSSVDPMKEPRGWHSAADFRDERVLIANGYTALDQDTASADIFDPNSNVFIPASSLTNALAKGTRR
jgi:hypothetical protein